jgi:hypothetical protein
VPQWLQVNSHSIIVPACLPAIASCTVPLQAR